MAVLLAVVVAIVLLLAVVIIRAITQGLAQSYRFLNHIAEGDGDLTRRFTVEGRVQNWHSITVENQECLLYREHMSDGLALLQKFCL